MKLLLIVIFFSVSFYIFADENEDSIYASCIHLVRSNVSKTMKESNELCQHITSEYNYICLTSLLGKFTVGEFIKDAQACSKINNYLEIECIIHTTAKMKNSNPSDIIRFCDTTVN